jgi:hypothetical protein
MISSRLPVAAALVLAGVLTACSGGPEHGPTETPSVSDAAAPAPATSSAAPTPEPTGLAALPAEDALDAVATAFARSEGVTVKGTVTVEKERVKVDVHLVRGKGGRGAVSPPDSTMQVIVIGPKVWLTGDKRFLTRAVGAANVARFKGRYVPGDTGNPLMADMAEHFHLLDYASLLPAKGLRAGPTGEQGGRSTITFTGAGGARLVAADSEDDPVPLRYRGPSSDGPVDLTFGYEEPIELKAPPRSKLVA